MTYKEVLTEVLKRSGNTKKGVARKIGANPSWMTMVWRREGIRVHSLYIIAKACGYEIVLRPQNYVRLMDKELLLDE